MLLNVAAFTGGIWWLQQQAELPAPAGVFLVLALAGLAWIARRSAIVLLRSVGAVLIALTCAGAGFYWAAGHAAWRLADRLPERVEGRDLRVVGVVAGLPERTARGWRFAFDVEDILTPDAYVPRRVLLSWFEADRPDLDPIVAPVVPGERWRLTARFKRPHATQNPHAFDAEAWLLERGVRATGYVRDTGPRERLEPFVWRPAYGVERLRGRIRAHLLQSLTGERYAGVVVALAIGDQQSIPADQWQVFTRTGVNHLMSISGLHVTMVASLAYLLMWHLWRRTPAWSVRVPARNAAVAAGLVGALAYALLAGFAVPTQRTLWMLAVVAVALWLRVFATASGMLAAALLAVLLLDPMAVLSAGFWLSFGAVALLMYVTGGRVATPGWFGAWGRAQWALFVGLVPLLLVLFQQVSVIAPVANAFAVPWVSFVVVPLSLLAAVIPWAPLAQLAHAAMLPAGIALEWVATMPAVAWAQHAPPTWAVAFALGGAAWLLLPRGVPARWLGALAMLPMVVAPVLRPAFGEAWIDVLDVGQGLAATVRTQSGSLVFDTGPAWSPEADSGSRIVGPFLRGSGVRNLQGAFVSHDDSDHAGGAARLFEMVPAEWVATPLPESHAALTGVRRKAPCVAGQAWEWSGVRFEVLHPEAVSYGSRAAKDNARSCVLRVATAGASVLFAADIEKDSERRLIAQGAPLASDILVVPHHGSRTSSTPEFIAAVLPEAAVFSVGYRNRFGHPAPDVVARYRDAGARIIRTDEGGAIHLALDAGGWRLERWRDVRRRYWQEH